MACSGNFKRLVSISHGATSLGEPSGGNVQETVTFGEHRPGNRVSPCLFFQSYAARAIAKYHGLRSPIAIATKATLTFTMEKLDGTTGTIAMVNALAGGNTYDLDQEVYVQSTEFVHDAADAEDTAPISVA